MEYVVYTSKNKLEAKMIVDILKNEGIECYYKNNSASQFYEYKAADIRQPQSIIVDAADAERAKELIEAFTVQNDSGNDEYIDHDYAKSIKADTVILVIMSIIVFGLLGLSIIPLFFK